MSSIGQSILMALTVTLNKYASLNVQAVHRREAKGKSKAKADAASITSDMGRRGLLLSTVAAAPQVTNNSDSKTHLLQKYLKKSEENKAKNDKERRDSFYKRNYKDYFEFIEGSLEGKSEDQLSESEKGILEWLRTNK